jgi:hypothetical protein
MIALAERRMDGVEAAGADVDRHTDAFGEAVCELAA